MIVDNGNTDVPENANSFREFALAFSYELNRRTQMTFVLDLGVAKKKLPEGEFGVLKDRRPGGGRLAGVSSAGPSVDRRLSEGCVMMV